MSATWRESTLMYERYVSPYRLLAQRFRSVGPFIAAVVFLSSPSWPARVIGAVLVLCCWAFWLVLLFRKLGIVPEHQEVDKAKALRQKEEDASFKDMLHPIEEDMEWLYQK